VGAAHADRTRAAVKMMLTTNHNRLDLIIILLQVNVQGTDQEWSLTKAKMLTPPPSNGRVIQWTCIWSLTELSQGYSPDVPPLVLYTTPCQI